MVATERPPEEGKKKEYACLKLIRMGLLHGMHKGLKWLKRGKADKHCRRVKTLIWEWSKKKKK